MDKVILVIDDDLGFLLAAERLLEAEGYSVVTASSAAIARSRLEAIVPDLILLDVVMPGEDGFALARELSRERRLDGVPVVLVTAVAENPGQMLEAFGKGDGCTASDILPKSLVHDQLLRVVAEALESRRPQRAPEQDR